MLGFSYLLLFTSLSCSYYVLSDCFLMWFISYILVFPLIFISSADADVRLARRIRRDTSDKGRDIGMILDQV